MGLQFASLNHAGHRHITAGSVGDASRDGVDGQLGVEEQKHDIGEEQLPNIAAVRAEGDPQPGKLGDGQKDPFAPGSGTRGASVTEAEVQEMDRLNQEWAQLIKDRPEGDVTHLPPSIPIAARKPKDVLTAVS